MFETVEKDEDVPDAVCGMPLAEENSGGTQQANKSSNFA
jgi:hypothetical protein